MATPRAAVVAVCHGGGPLPILGDPAHAHIINTLQSDVPSILRLNTPQAPKAVVIVTAHWQTEQPTISNGRKHNLYYDYSGFPSEAYGLQYNAPGEPEVAQQVCRAFKEEGLKPSMDSRRGWDHGVFVPMLLIDPSGSVPVVQVSVLRSESVSQHYQMGKALSKLRDENIAIVGSGSPSFHNLRTWFSGQTHGADFRQRNTEWAAAVDNAFAIEDATKRGKQLEDWRKFPHAYEMHPRGGSEHFSPLLVCAGAAGNGAAKSKSDDLIGVQMKTYWWD